MTTDENKADEAELARLGIRRVQRDVFQWGQYIYSSRGDAIAAARREQKQ